MNCFHSSSDTCFALRLIYPPHENGWRLVNNFNSASKHVQQGTNIAQLWLSMYCARLRYTLMINPPQEKDGDWLTKLTMLLNTYSNVLQTWHTQCHKHRAKY